MNHLFYPRLAYTNIKKQSRIYIPYLIMSIFIVMMYDMMFSLAKNQGLQYEQLGNSLVPMVLNLGVYIVLIFAIIFLFYINSFIMKRRRKEFALYNILGMDKKHIMVVLFFETLITMFVSIVLGFVFGSLLNQLLYLILVKLCHLNTALYFKWDIMTLWACLKVFVPLFMIIYGVNILQIKLSQPIELLRSHELGEKEPRVKWFIGILGLGCLVIGYYLSQVIDDPSMSLISFFIAVILVIIGTYCLFTVGSIMILKLLKKNKRFYYQTRHFVAVSQMMYRMKQNAVGLASICILCTCILVMLSSTVTLYVSIDDTVKQLLNEDAMITMYNHEEGIERQDIIDIHQPFISHLKDSNIGITQTFLKKTYSRMFYYDNERFSYDIISTQFKRSYVIAMTLEDYNEAYHHKETLNDQEVLVNDNVLKDKNLVINNEVFKRKKIIDDPYLSNGFGSGILDDSYQIVIVFKDYQTLKNIMYPDGKMPTISYILSIDYMNENDARKAHELVESYYNIPYGVKQIKGIDINTYYDSQVYLRQSYTDMFGGLLFLGIFLGIMFLMGTILIMYYKQLSEGYEDQKRYTILQNIGMTQKEVKQTIQTQVLIFFFLPIIVAIIHMIFAFNIISRMFQLIVMSKISLFVSCTVIACLILVVIYTIAYLFSTKTYYKIVQQKSDF